MEKGEKEIKWAGREKKVRGGGRTAGGKKKEKDRKKKRNKGRKAGIEKGNRR